MRKKSETLNLNSKYYQNQTQILSSPVNNLHFSYRVRIMIRPRLGLPYFQTKMEDRLLKVIMSADVQLSAPNQVKTKTFAGRAGGTAPRTSRPKGGGRPGQGPRPEHRGVFLLGNDFNTCYDATLICLCACV